MGSIPSWTFVSFVVIAFRLPLPHLPYAL